MENAPFGSLPDRLHRCEDRLGTWWHIHQEPDDRVLTLRYEAFKRLAQCEWCLRRAQEIEREDGADGSAFDRTGWFPNELEIVVEAFYYSAHAFLKLCEKVDSLGLRRVGDELRRCDIHRVRNHFVEHTEKPDGVPGPHFSWCDDDGSGPKIKPFANSKHGPKKQGMYLHASEMIDALARELDRLGA